MKIQISRCKRRNRTYGELNIRGKGGIFDLMDNLFKSKLRINDEEYDFILEEIDDDMSKMDLMIKYVLPNKNDVFNITECKTLLKILEEIMIKYNETDI